MQTILQYDVFILAKDLNRAITKGMKGVILEVWGEDSFEVEFVRDDGTNFEYDGATTFTVDKSFIRDIIWREEQKLSLDAAQKSQVNSYQRNKIFGYVFLSLCGLLLLISFLWVTDFFNEPVWHGITRQVAFWMVSIYLAFVFIIYRNQWTTPVIRAVGVAHAVCTFIFLAFFIRWINVTGATLFFETQWNLNQSITNNIKATERYPYVAGSFIVSVALFSILLFLLARKTKRIH